MASSPYANLPGAVTVNSQINYYNNFFNTTEGIGQNENDAIVGFFQQASGSKVTGKLMAASVLYTAAVTGTDPMVLIDQLKQLKLGRRIQEKTPIDSIQFISTFTSYTDINESKSEFEVGQLFYVPGVNIFYKLVNSETGTILEAATNYIAERVNLSNGNIVYNYYQISYRQEQNELNAYLTMFLNLNRVNSSLLGISNSPQTGKYVQRAVLP